MPEINPYESPQSELTRIPSEPSRAVPVRRDGRYFVLVLVGFQSAACVLFYLSVVVRDRSPINHQHQEQAYVEIFWFIFFGLGLLMILFSIWRASLKLMIGEVLALVIFFWLTLPKISLALS